MGYFLSNALQVEAAYPWIFWGVTFLIAAAFVNAAINFWHAMGDRDGLAFEAHMMGATVSWIAVVLVAAGTRSALVTAILAAVLILLGTYLWPAKVSD